MSKLSLSFKGNVLRVYPVIKGSMTIGNDPACTIHIDSLALQPQHARIDTQGETSVLVDLESESGTFVNNERIEKQMLKDGDVIRIGKHTLTFIYEAVPESEAELVAEETAIAEEAQQPATPASANNESGSFAKDGKKHAWLQIMSGQNLGKTLSLNRAMTNLGKPGVATAVITRRNDGYFLSHLEGEHPPLVENEPIGDRSVQLKDGETIVIGNIKMLFFLD